MWRFCITKFHLFETRPFAGWLKLVTALNHAHIATPSGLETLSFSERTVLDEVNASNGDIILIWQSALCWRGDSPQEQPFFLSKREAVSRDSIAQLRVDSVPETTAFKEWEAKRMSLGLPSDFDTLLPLTKNRLLANSGNRTSEIEHFLELGDRVNIIRSVGVSLRFLSSGLMSYANFCSLLSRPFIPPTERSVLLWRATFATGRTFKNYIPHSDWATKAVYAAAEGLRKARKRTSKFPNFLFMADVFDFVEFLGRAIEFALLSFISFYFLLEFLPRPSSLGGPSMTTQFSNRWVNLRRLL